MCDAVTVLGTTFVAMRVSLAVLAAAVPAQAFLHGGVAPIHTGLASRAFISSPLATSASALPLPRRCPATRICGRMQRALAPLCVHMHASMTFTARS